MSKKPRWLAMLCIASFFIAVGGCSDDDDPILSQPVSADQAAALIEDAVPFILEFGTDIADLLEAVSVNKSGNLSRQIECTPIPGLEADFFCTDPAAGEICPVNGMTTEWVFTNCMETAPDPGMVDGTVTVTESGNVFDLDFDLDVDDGTINGLMVVELGDPCVTITYTDFDLNEGDVSNTLNGTNTICPESISGTLDVSVKATGIQRFLMEISFVQGIPTVLVVSPLTQEPLYTCTYNPLSETAQCFPFGDF